MSKFKEDQANDMFKTFLVVMAVVFTLGTLVGAAITYFIK